MRVPQPNQCRGSLKWIRQLINGRPDLLDDELRRAGALVSDASINWVSPKKGDDWAEYSDAEFLNKLGYSQLTPALSEFWPRRGPQWDALGRSTDGTVFLVEAKAHLGELQSTCAAKAPPSRALITSSLERTRNALGVTNGADWSTHYYQYANRLAHLGFLRDQGVQAYLVFVYFIGDTGMPGAPISRAHWDGANSALKKHLGLADLPPIPGVIDLYVDVSQLPDAAEDTNPDCTMESYPAGYPYKERFGTLSNVLAADGGAVYAGDNAEGFAVITDEGTVADVIEEDIDCVTVRLFLSRQDRDAYVAQLREQFNRNRRARD